ncbi:MAG: hypothetical protein ACKPCP_34680 [Sphaerospermopsis kisseleviana]
MHNNPVRRGYVDDPAHWRYSSYRNYMGLPSLLEVELIDFGKVELETHDGIPSRRLGTR